MRAWTYYLEAIVSENEFGDVFDPVKEAHIDSLLLFSPVPVFPDLRSARGVVVFHASLHCLLGQSLVRRLKLHLFKPNQV